MWKVTRSARFSIIKDRRCWEDDDTSISNYFLYCTRKCRGCRGEEQSPFSGWFLLQPCTI